MARGTVAKRYEELGLADALSRPFDYPSACQELSLILRMAYAKLPKNIQSIVFADILFAFHLLPEVQTTSGISSANFLLQAAEVSLPKQKKSLAVSEFKHAMVAHKRRGKALHVVSSVQLPQDVLVQICSFLDMRSLVNVSLVNRAWNSAACDNMLWQSQFSLLFGEYETSCKRRTHKLLKNENDVDLLPCVESLDTMANIDWKEAFKRKYIGNPTWRSTSNRALCGHCKSIIWLSSMTCAKSHLCSKLRSQKLKIRLWSICLVILTSHHLLIVMIVILMDQHFSYSVCLSCGPIQGL